jgi:hypothetical protein
MELIATTGSTPCRRMFSSCLLRPHVGPEARLSDQEVAGADGDQVGDNRGVAVRDVAEGTRVDEDGSVLQGLQQVRLEGVLHHDGHRAGCLELLGRDGIAVPGVADDDAAEAGAQVLEVLGQGQDGHRLGGGGDVEARLPRHAVAGRAEARHDVAQ